MMSVRTQVSQIAHLAIAHDLVAGSPESTPGPAAPSDHHERTSQAVFRALAMWLAPDALIPDGPLPVGIEEPSPSARVHPQTASAIMKAVRAGLAPLVAPVADDDAGCGELATGAGPAAPITTTDTGVSRQP